MQAHRWDLKVGMMHIRVVVVVMLARSYIGVDFVVQLTETIK